MHLQMHMCARMCVCVYTYIYKCVRLSVCVLSERFVWHAREGTSQARKPASHVSPPMLRMTVSSRGYTWTCSNRTQCASRSRARSHDELLLELLDEDDDELLLELLLDEELEELEDDDELLLELLLDEDDDELLDELEDELDDELDEDDDELLLELLDLHARICGQLDSRCTHTHGCGASE